MRHLGRSLTGWARAPVSVWYWVWRQWSSGGPFSGASSPLTRLGVSTGRREVGEGGRSAGSIFANVNAVSACGTVGEALNRNDLLLGC